MAIQVQQVSSDQILKTAGAFVNGAAVGLPVANAVDQFMPLPQLIAALLDQIAKLDREVQALKAGTPLP